MIFLHMYTECYIVFGCNGTATIGDTNYFHSHYVILHVLCAVRCHEA